MKSNELLIPQLPLLYQGKVRDIYEIPGYETHRLFVATDRVSTHNIEHESPIPGKGVCLTMITALFSKLLTSEGIGNHVVAYGKDIYDYVPELEKIDGKGGDYFARSMIVEKLSMLPYELVFRSRFGGSYWDIYREGESDPYGLSLAPGLQLMTPLEIYEGYPVFTPTHKSKTDAPVRAWTVMENFGGAVDLARRAYGVVRKRYRAYGMEIVDSKFEAGFRQGFVQPLVADEIGTPDCSRIVSSNGVRIGKKPRFLDKQIVRDVAEAMWGRGKRIPLVFPEDTLKYFANMYRDVAERVTGVHVREWIWNKGRVCFRGLD